MVSFTALTKFFTAFTALTFIILTFCGIDSASPGYRVLFIDYAEREFVSHVEGNLILRVYPMEAIQEVI